MPAASGVIVCAGNSLTFGATADYGWPVPCAATLNLGSGFLWYNVAVNGQSTPDMLVPATVASQVDSKYDGTRDINICTAWELTNDFNSGWCPVEHAYERIRRYCGERQSMGWKVVVGTLMPLHPSGGFFFDYDCEPFRTAVNTLIRNNWTSFADALCDIGADSILGIANADANATYFAVDRIHLTDVGQTHAANVCWAPAIASLLT
jgi:hypothetical protein